MPRDKNPDQVLSAVATPNREKPKDNNIALVTQKLKYSLGFFVWLVNDFLIFFCDSCLGAFLSF